MGEMERALRYWVPLLLATVGLAACGGPYHDMEDAFADDDEACPQSVKPVLCRLGNTQMSTLTMLDICLCTHYIYDLEDSAVLELLRGSNVRLVPSFPLRDLLVREEGDERTVLNNLLDRIRSQKLADVDITITGGTDQRQSQNILTELGRRLQEERINSSAGRALRLTFVDHVPTAPFVTEIMRNTEVASFTFFTDMAQDEDETFRQLEQISKLDIPLNKTYFGISLTTTTGTSKTDADLFPEMCSELSALGDSEETYPGRHSSKIISNLRIKVEYVKQSNAGGISLWSLAEDDAKGTCGMGPFPVLQNIWDSLNQSPSTFDDFADLDIVLSTGESQERLLLQDLEANPEEMKKLPCERVGFYRHPTDCTKFYHCSEFRTPKLNHTGPYAGFLYKCPEGLIYDERQGSCIWPSWSDPCQGSGELLPVPAKKFSCVVPGFHVDPENCRWFYYCSDLGDGRLEAFEFLCPSDLLGYDEKQMLCNWKWTIPVCMNNGKQPEMNSRTVSAPETIHRTTNKLSPQNRTAKALRLQEIPSPPRSQSNTAAKPAQLNAKQGTDERNTIAEHQIHFTETNKNIPVHDVSLSAHTESTEYLRDSPEKVHEVVDDILSNTKLVKENQTSQDKKIGTAVWRRSWINTGRDNRRISSIPDPFKDDFRGGLFPDDESNRQNPNRNNIAEGEKSTKPVPVENNEEKKLFKGRIRKINLNRETYIPESRREDGNTFTREINDKDQNTNLNLLQRHGHEQNGNTAHSSMNSSQNEEDFETLSVQSNSKRNPFASVRCAKLGDTYSEQDFGCTSEVSLTIHMRRDKDASKYILKEDQIRRTAYQESQQIQYLKNPEGKKAETNFQMAQNLSENIEYENTSEITLNASYSIQSSGNVQETKQPQAWRKKSSDVFELQTGNIASVLEASKDDQRRTNLNDETRSFQGQIVQSTPQNSHDNSRNFEHFILKSEFTVPRENENTQITNKAEQKNHHDEKTMPVHFYPQGVLLNIDLAHINEIPPQILLEVDNMLRRYMTEGDIDINLLEKKLNATKGSMTGKEQPSMEPEEIMEMIKMIENVINTTTGRESDGDSTNPSHGDITNNTSDYTDSNQGTKLEDLHYENVTSFTESASVSLRVGQTGTTEINNDTNGFKTPLISDKLQNSEISKHINDDQVNTTPRPFGRRRLLRKFRHPSIREQLERQNQFRDVHNVNDRNTQSAAITESTISEIDTSISFMHPSTNSLIQSERTRLNTNPSIREQLEKQSQFRDTRKINNGYTPSFTVTENTIGEIDTSVSFAHPSTKNWIQTERGSLDASLNKHLATSVTREVPPTPDEGGILRDSFRNYGNRVQAPKAYDAPKQNSDYSNFSPPSTFITEIEQTEQYRTRQNTRNINAAARHNVQRSQTNPSSNIQFENKITFSDNHDNKGVNTRGTFSNDHLGPPPSPFITEIEQTEQYRTRQNSRNINTAARHNIQRSQTDPSSNIKFENKITFSDNHDNKDVNTRGTFPNDRLGPNYDTQPINTISRQSNTYSERRYDYSQVSRSTDSGSGTRSNSRTEYTENFDSGVAQGRKKRKIRILVRKLIGSDTESEHDPPINPEYDTDIEQIPQNVLNNLKKKFLRKLSEDGTSKIELQIQFQDHVWNVPFVNEQSETDLSPSVCTRAGLFQHPRDCTMFYECFWDKWLQRFTLHVFSCPVRLVYDHSVRGCSRPSSDSHCRTANK